MNIYIEADEKNYNCFNININNIIEELEKQKEKGAKTLKIGVLIDNYGDDATIILNTI